jgi:alpha-L-rhamnosidase
VRLKVKGTAGATLRLTYAEQRHGQSPHRNDGKGLVDQSGIQSPNYIQYTLRGAGGGEEEETWFCDLFYTGFQYLQLEGAVPAGLPNPEKKPVVTEIESVHVRADAPVAGTFTCSNAVYGKIDTMISWAVRSNLSHVLTDCPHREKLGWLEVPHLMWDSMAYRFDLSSFGPKVCRDIADSQSPDGMIPTVAPSYPTFPGGFHYTPEWGAAGVLIPWYVYQWYGDRRNLADHYDTMRRFVDYMRDTSSDLVPKAGLGDWYDYGHGDRPGPSKFTPPELSAMAIFHDCARRVADAAAVLGKADDERAYRALAADIRRAFNRRFYRGNGAYENHGSCQTANAMALVCGLVEPSEESAVADAIVKDLEERKYQQTSGDVGFHYLVRALTDYGKSDALFRILNRDELGSYAFLVNAGWTSLPEAWDADHHSSMNHCMLGHVQEWFNRDLAGLQPEAVAWKAFRVRPMPGEGVTSASATLDTPYGRVASAWKQEQGTFTIDVTVPANTTARVHVPAARREDVIEGGDDQGVKFVEMHGGRAVFEAGSGTYRFHARR